jgi:hypothetical protein
LALAGGFVVNLVQTPFVIANDSNELPCNLASDDVAIVPQGDDFRLRRR